MLVFRDQPFLIYYLGMAVIGIASFYAGVKWRSQSVILDNSVIQQYNNHQLNTVSLKSKIEDSTRLKLKINGLKKYVFFILIVYVGFSYLKENDFLVFLRSNFKNFIPFLAIYFLIFISNRYLTMKIRKNRQFL